MLAKKLFTGGGAGGLTRSALHNPLGWFQEQKANRDPEIGKDCGSNLALNPSAALEKVLIQNFGDDREFLRAKIGIEKSKGHCAPVVDRGMPADDFFDILRINILTAKDEQVFLSPHNEKFFTLEKAQIASAIPPIDYHMRGEVGA